MRFWPQGSRVHWRTYEAAQLGGDHHGEVIWSRRMPASPAALVELVAVLRRLRREGVRPVPRPSAVLRVGRGVIVDVRDYRGRRRVFTPWMRRLLPEEDL